jgi:hypothetical protein
MSKKNRKAWRASVQRANESKQEARSQAAAPKPLRGLARAAFIDKIAQEMFEAHGGAQMDKLIRTGQLTLDAFESQMLAARDGGEGWGPDVSVYEARMTRALNERLLREKRSWLRELRKQVEQALDAEDAMLQEQAEAAAEPEKGTVPIAADDTPDFDAGGNTNSPAPGTRSAAAISHESS